MKKSILLVQYNQLLTTYKKLNRRFEKQISLGRFRSFCVQKQQQILARLDKIRQRLASLQTILQGTVAAGLLLGSVTTSFAQTSPVANGPEQIVNSFTTNFQQFPDVASDNSGNYVVTWTSSSQEGGTVNGTGIYLQRFDATGTKVGSEIHVNTYVTGNQILSSVAMDNSGNFVVVWQGAYQDGNNNGVFGQRFDNTGSVVGSEFKINTTTLMNQNNPSVAMDDDGDFIVVWESESLDGADFGIAGQRFDNSGTAQGSEFLINTYVTNRQNNPDVAMDPSGNFVVTWVSGAQDGEGQGVYAQRYTNTGSALGSEFIVNTKTTDNQSEPSIAMANNGAFVIAWGDGTVVKHQRFDAAGTKIGTEEMVSTAGSFSKTPHVDMDASGNYLISWNGTQIDTNAYGVAGQRYTSAGAKDGITFRVNTQGSGNQRNPIVTLKSVSDFFITFQSEGQDGNNWAVVTKRFKDGYIPTTIALSNNQVDEHTTSASLLGTLSTTDPDEIIGDTYTYSFVTGSGDTHNTLFQINGDQLSLIVGQDYEVNNSLSVRIRTTDKDGLYFDQVISIDINDIANDPPTFIVVSPTSVNENIPANFAIDLSTQDANTGDTFTYSLVSGFGSDDNALFSIDNNSLILLEVPDYETREFYTIRLRSTDNTNLFVERTLSIFINDLVETSVLKGVNNAAISLHPNPSNNKVYVNLDGEVQVRVMDSQGKVHLQSNLVEQYFSVSNLKTGFYFVELIQNNQKVSLPLIVE